MYTVVLATMLTASTAAPDWGCRGCSGCHSCWACCGGCYGCGGCWGCGGCYSCGCYGCSGCGCYGCYGCSACYGCGCYGCYGGCSVSCGAGITCGFSAAAIAKPADKPTDKKGTALPGHATITVALPADARLFVDGDPVSLSAGALAFRTPDLEPGREYFYTLKAEAVRDGQAVTETKRVSFHAGETARVEFARLGPPAEVARVTVTLPEDAKLWVDDVPCTLTSGTRSFDTPRLEPGKSYAYTLKAEVVRDGRTVSDSRRVTVQAGKQTAVDFGALTPLAAARR